MATRLKTQRIKQVLALVRRDHLLDIRLLEDVWSVFQDQVRGFVVFAGWLQGALGATGLAYHVATEQNTALPELFKSLLFEEVPDLLAGEVVRLGDDLALLLVKVEVEPRAGHVDQGFEGWNFVGGQVEIRVLKISLLSIFLFLARGRLDVWV